MVGGGSRAPAMRGAMSPRQAGTAPCGTPKCPPCPPHVTSPALGSAGVEGPSTPLRLWGIGTIWLAAPPQLAAGN